MKLLKKLLPLLLIFSMMLSFASCRKDPDNGDKDNGSDDQTKYTITVLNPLGKPLSGVVVYVHKDDGNDYNVCTVPAITDEAGKAVFTLDPSYVYSVQLAGLPSVYSALEGYNRAERYAFDSNNISVTVDLKEGYTPDSYDVGDYIANFTLTDVEGNKYELYSLLSEKKVVILNFWFYGCGPCAAEFPALNASYLNYRDVAEVLAINDYPRETVEHVTSYESYRGFTLDMPLFKTEYGSEVSLARFPSDGYPTTVIIDRYGSVSMIHVGTNPSMSKWNALFDHYTSDTYDGTPFTDF